MKLITKENLKVVLGLGFSVGACLLAPNNAANAEACSGSVTANCYITPTRYVIKVYEMGLCWEDPLGGTYLDGDDNIRTDSLIDESTCQATFVSSNGGGVKVNLAVGSGNHALTGLALRPSVGRYSYAYIKIDNTFGIAGSYDTGSTKYCSIGTGDVTSAGGCTGSAWDEDLLDFSNGRTCNNTPGDIELAGSEVFTTGITGTMKAVLAKPSGTYGKYEDPSTKDVFRKDKYNSVGTYVGDTSCGSSTRLFGVFKPDQPVVIKESTEGLHVNFSITNRGMTVLPDGSGGVSGFSSGPFSPSFKVF